MFNSITGIITHKQGSELRLQTGGIEWDIAIPPSDALSLPEVGDEGRVWTWLLHREDLMKVYGFVSEERRLTFLELQKVEGIGAKAALRIMGGITQDDLERALETDDLARLQAVPGLGKKTAQKMLLALKGKLVRQDEPEAAYGYADIAAALADMGYDRKNIAAAIAKAVDSAPLSGTESEKESQVFKRALAFLTGG